MTYLFDFLQFFVVQTMVAFYNLTTLGLGDWDMKAVISDGSDAITSSSLIHLIQWLLLPICIFLFIGIARAGLRHRDLLRKMAAQQNVPAMTEVPERPLTNRWQEILGHVESVREGEWKFAVIEADKLVDDVLKNLFAGETMGERLMNIDKTQLVTLDGLWEAHKIRNRLAHDMNYFLRHAEAVRAIHLFEQTLHELGTI